MSAVTELWATSFEAGAVEPGHSSAVLPGAATGDGRTAGRSCPPFRPGYTEETSPEDAAVDWLEMSSFSGSRRAKPRRRRQAATSPAVRPRPSRPSGPPHVGQPGHVRPAFGGHASRLVLCPCRPGAPGDFRLRRVGLARVELSSFLPVVESFGLAVVEAVPWHFQFGPGHHDAYVDDIGLRVDTPLMEPGVFDPAQAGPRLVEALEAVLSGRGRARPAQPPCRRGRARLARGRPALRLLRLPKGHRRAVGGGGRRRR